MQDVFGHFPQVTPTKDRKCSRINNIRRRTFIVNRAVEEWFETVGDVRMDAMVNHSKVVVVPAKAVVLTPAAAVEMLATPKYTEQQQVADDLAALPVIDAPLQQPN